MRRISLALALVGAVAATGCSSGAKPASSSGAKGTAGVNFDVLVNNQGPGTVVSNPAGINCAANTKCTATFASGMTVTLTATASVGQYFNGFFGDCSGSTCTLTGDADKYVVSYFSGQPQAHPNFNDPALHAAAVLDGVLQCANCHGSQLQGMGLAPSCSACHAFPPALTMTALQVAHFDPASPAFGNHSGRGWDAACQRCHTDQGFRDYVGDLASPATTTTTPAVPEPAASDNHLDGAFLSTNPLKSCTDAEISDGTCNAAAYTYGPLKCGTCHNPKAEPLANALTTVRFPSSGSGAVFVATATAPDLNLVMNPAVLPTSNTVDGSTGVCAQCHQGRESTTSMNTWIMSTANPSDLDAVTTVSFINPHYLGAGGTLFGSQAKAWAEYPGMIYTGRNLHGGQASCTFCHDPHNPGANSFTDAKIASRCGSCHFDELSGAPVATFLQLEESRQFGFEGDIDGDGVQESVKAEIGGLAAKLNVAMQAYAKNVVGTAIVYDAAYPYYFVDANGDGVRDPTTETTAFKSFTPRLMRAAFNYKWYVAEPGAWAHNPRYAVEILYDGITDLNAGLVAKGFAAVPNGKRAFNGHFGAAEDASPYAAMVYHATAPQGFTSAACYQCHGGAGGFAAYLASAPAALTDAVKTNKVTAMQCNTCHTYNGSNMTAIRSDVAKVYFPPQKAIDATNSNGVVSIDAANLPYSFAVCGSCHSGRENGASVIKAIGTAAADSFTLGALNPHYLGAAGMMMGSNAGVMVQYAGKSYTGYPAFWNGSADNGPHGSPHAAKCASCHAAKGSKHTFEIDLTTTVPPGTYHGAQNTAACAGCHTGQYALDPKIIEYEDASAELYATMRAYVTTNLTAIQAAVIATYGTCKDPAACTATEVANQANAAAMTNVCYNGASHPYYFVETAAGCTSTQFKNFNPALLKGSFNYLWTQKEPGAWAHNEFYVLQVIYDTIVDLGGTPMFTVTAVKDYSTGLCVATSPLNRGCAP